MSLPTPEHPASHDTVSHSRSWLHSIWLRRTLLTLGALVVLAAIALGITAIALRHDLRANLLANENLLDGSTAIAGLTAPVTITRDAQNVPSIHAAALDDLLFTQGYITASDRLFQMDALRRHGAGELAEILGPSLLPHDREQRTLQLRAAADRAVAALPPDQLHQLQAYARGVNAFIDSHDGQAAHNGPSGSNTLPIEFHILRYTPAPWQPRDSLLIAIIMAQDLATDFPSKLNRGALAAHLPANLLPDLYPVGSWRDHPPTQDTPNLTTPSTPVLQIPLDSTQSSVLPQDLQRLFTDLRANECNGCRNGSNNWAVAGAHTATGAPLLSNDMHLSLTAPDIWYEAVLHADGPTPLSVEGFTLPGVPFVIVGRNPYVAWGFTNSGADVQDVLVEHLRGNGLSTEYQRPDHTWAPVTHHLEHIHVRAGSDVTLDVLTTDTTLGTTTIPTPIITPLLPSEHRALALAWTIYDPRTVTSPFLDINSATDAASLVAAFAGFGTVSQNLVYADAHHIGYHLLGRIPIRGAAIQHPRTEQPFILPDTTPSEDDQDESGNPSASIPHPHVILASFSPSSRHNAVILSGAQRSRRTPKVQTPPTPSAPSTKTLPAAPTTDYTIGSPLSPTTVDALDATQAWSGYIPYDALPSILDPASGIIATANARIAPDNYPYAITLNWADPYRVERIHHLLEAAIASGHPLTPADMLRIQTDIHSEFDLLVAQRLAYALDHSQFAKKDARLQQAANLLRNWTGDVAIDSPAADITNAAEHELWPMLLAPQIIAHDHPRDAHPRDASKPSPSAKDAAQYLGLYTWDEQRTALEQLLQNTPARWLPPSFANWNDLLTTAVERGLHRIDAPRNLATLTYGHTHPIEIAHPVFGSHSPISTMLGVALGTGPQPNSGDSTTVKQTGLHFGPSERFTADLSNPDNTHANITTGESGNPASPSFLDQFQPWLHGTTFPLPLDHPTIQHTLTLTPN
jgi:penicillin amidase